MLLEGPVGIRVETGTLVCSGDGRQSKRTDLGVWARRRSQLKPQAQVRPPAC